MNKDNIIKIISIFIVFLFAFVLLNNKNNFYHEYGLAEPIYEPIVFAPQTQSEDNPIVWNVNVPENIHETLSEQNLTRIFPEQIDNQPILNLYPENGEEKIYPVEGQFLYKSNDPEIKDIQFDEGYYAHYINPETKNPISLKVYQLNKNSNSDDLAKTLDYMFDYDDDMYERIYVNSDKVKILGAYVEWDEAQKFPLDYKSKVTNFVIYDPETKKYIEIGINHENDLNKVNEILQNFISNISSQNNIPALTDIIKYFDYPIYKDIFISRLIK